MLLGPDFVDFLEALTGITGLISDNAFQANRDMRMHVYVWWTSAVLARVHVYIHVKLSRTFSGNAFQVNCKPPCDSHAVYM